MCPLQILEQKDSVFTLPGLKTDVGGQAPGTGLCARFHLKFLDCRASLWESGRKAHTLPPPPGPAALCSSMPPATLCGSVEPGSVIPCVCASQLLVVSGAPRPMGSLVVQTVKNPRAVRETWIPSLGEEDPLEEGMATMPVSLPGESHGQRSVAGYSP